MTPQNLDLDDLPGEPPFVVTVAALRAFVGAFVRAGLEAQTRGQAPDGMTVYAAARLSGRPEAALHAAIRRGFLAAERRSGGTWSVTATDLYAYLRRSELRSRSGADSRQSRSRRRFPNYRKPTFVLTPDHRPFRLHPPPQSSRRRSVAVLAPKPQGRSTMTIPQTEPHRRPRAALPDDDMAVMTFREWCELNGFSARTGHRILAGAKAQRPIVTMLSDRRIGITRGNNRRWQEKRAR